MKNKNTFLILTLMMLTIPLVTAEVEERTFNTNITLSVTCNGTGAATVALESGLAQTIQANASATIPFSITRNVSVTANNYDSDIRNMTRTCENQTALMSEIKNLVSQKVNGSDYYTLYTNTWLNYSILLGMKYPEQVTSLTAELSSCKSASEAYKLQGDEYGSQLTQCVTENATSARQVKDAEGSKIWWAIIAAGITAAAFLFKDRWKHVKEPTQQLGPR